MERTKIIRNSSFMNFNSSPKERYLEEGEKKKKKEKSENIKLDLTNSLTPFKGCAKSIPKLLL